MVNYLYLFLYKLGVLASKKCLIQGNENIVTNLIEMVFSVGIPLFWMINMKGTIFRCLFPTHDRKMGSNAYGIHKIGKHKKIRSNSKQWINKPFNLNFEIFWENGRLVEYGNPIKYLVHDGNPFSPKMGRFIFSKEPT